ncbi:phospholipase [Glaciibacter flavus]|uniref:Phospholipase n=1 Tax=Orlajensenia flava TaxID=2565934 RepID=A0A4S4FJV2_9MICO|nr:alpha/beta hydrolase-fold protein [Glaciibacter flavus]THG30398.1 phospholipase [Glaciibacter flavus]
MQIDDAAVLWSAGTADRADRPLLVLLHGYGSHEGDLFSLAPYLPLAPVIASVRAPLTSGAGAAWYELIDSDDGFTARPDDVRESTDAVLAWLDALDPRPASVGLLGFSQGGSIALELLRARPDTFDFAAVLAGFVAATDGPNDDELARMRPPVFWGRGTDDPVIPRSSVDRTQSWLPGHSTLTERIYEGLGHALSQAELDDTVRFLRDRYA